jgi:hypothetical protein
MTFNGGTEPDISTLLMLGATNVQNGRAELAEKVSDHHVVFVPYNGDLS